MVCRLSESYRDSQGRPRQRSVARLGSVRETMPVNHRIHFWGCVDYALDQMTLSPDTVARIRQDIAKRVPFADEAERQVSSLFRRH